MRILAFDPGVALGVVLGESTDGAIPTSYERRLKKPKEETALAADAIGRLVRDICYQDRTRPDLIVYEMWIPIFNPDDDRKDKRSIRRSPASIDMPRLLVGAVRGVAACYGVTCEGVHMGSARSHFTGRNYWGSSELSKLASRYQAAQLGYVHAECRELNRTDALAIWETAAYKHGGRLMKPPALPKDFFSRWDAQDSVEDYLEGE